MRSTWWPSASRSVLRRFGGHAMAAGCSIAEAAFRRLRPCACSRWPREWLDAATLTRTLRTDGPLAVEWFNPQTVALLDAQVWGQGFEAPLFCDEVEVLQQRLVGRQAPEAARAPCRRAARCHLVRPCRAGGRARAPGLPPEPGRMAGPAAGANGRRGGGLSAALAASCAESWKVDMLRSDGPAAVWPVLAVRMPPSPSW